MVTILKILTGIWSGLKAAANWFWFTATPKTKAAILIGLLVVAVLGYILFLRHEAKNYQLEIKRLEKEKNTAEFQGRMKDVAIIDGRIEALKIEEKQIEANVNASNQALQESINTDSSDFDADEATERFCARFPEDSSCQ